MESLRRGFANIVSKIRKVPIIDEKTLREVIRDIQRELLKADVSVDIILEISKRVEQRIKEEKLPPGFSKRELLLKVIYEELVRILGGEQPYELKIHKQPYVMMLVGIQGSGKTTTAAKLANFLKKKGYKVGLIAADNFRPGAYDQLKQLAEQVGVYFYGDPKNSSAIDIARKGLDYMLKEKVSIVIIDTAGRHKEERELLREMKEMEKAINPDEVILVLDGTIGKQAGPQAEAFHSATPIGSIIVTKLDGAARGGGALMAVAKTGAKIAFIGTGENIDELELFDPQSFVSRLLGMGALKALIERFRAAEMLDRKRAEAIASGKFTLLDMRDQFESLRKMGPLKRIMELLPSGLKLPKDFEKMSEESIDRWIAIMNSMTYEELLNPEIIDRSRIIRIARGSGTRPGDVKALLIAYHRSKKLMKKLMRQRRRSMRGLEYFGV